MTSEKLPVTFYGNDGSGTVLVQMVSDYDLPLLPGEIFCIRELSGRTDLLLAAVKVNDWHESLSPWPAPAVHGKVAFGSGAEKTLCRLTEEMILPMSEDRGRRFYLGGYSFAGLFSLWAGYNTDLFTGISAVSPSVWFPGFTGYASEHRMRTENVYLSLGKKEERARNPVMAKVGNAIREESECLRRDGANSILEWNDGNHFQEPGRRMAKGFAWLLSGNHG